MNDPTRNEAATVGPRCGCNPNFRLSDGDRQAVYGFTAYLAARRAGMPPTPDGTVDPEWVTAREAAREAADA